jgi:hypothetical protein
LLGIPLLVNALLYFYWSEICLYFMGGMYFFLDPVIDNLRFIGVPTPIVGGQLYVPLIASSHPDPQQWWTGFAIACCMLAIGHAPTKQWIPVRYLLGFLGYLQLMAQLYFAHRQDWTGGNPQDYLADVMLATCYWIWCVPWLLTLCFNLFPFSLIHKLRISALTVLYLVVVFPVQYAFQAWVLHSAGSLWTPLLYFLTSVPLNIFITLSIYAIGLSWPDAEHPETR